MEKKIMINPDASYRGPGVYLSFPLHEALPLVRLMKIANGVAFRTEKGIDISAEDIVVVRAPIVLPSKVRDLVCQVVQMGRLCHCGERGDTLHVDLDLDDLVRNADVETRRSAFLVLMQLIPYCSPLLRTFLFDYCKWRPGPIPEAMARMQCVLKIYRRKAPTDTASDHNSQACEEGGEEDALLVPTTIVPAAVTPAATPTTAAAKDKDE